MINNHDIFIYPPYTFIRDPEDLRLIDIIKKSGECGRECVCVIGYPWDWSTAGFPGARFAPQILRKYLHEVRVNEDLCLCDLGDIAIAPGDQDKSEERLREAIRFSLDNCKGFIVFGGDHSLTKIVMSILVERFGRVSLVMFDAHLDMRKLSEGKSSGTHLRELSERYKDRIDVAVIGYREKYNPKYMINYAKTINALLIEISMIKENLSRVKELLRDFVRNKITYLSIDADSLDPSQCPGVNSIVPDGIYLRELLELLHTIHAAGSRVIGADIVEVVPSRDPNDLCSRNMAYISYHVINYIYRS